LSRNLHFRPLANQPKRKTRDPNSYLPFEPLQSGHERAEVVNGFVVGDVRISGIGNAGDHGGDLLLYDAVIGSDRLLVVLEWDPQELVLQLQGLSQMDQPRRRWGRSRGRWGRRGGRYGGRRSVGKRIHFHFEKESEKETKENIISIAK